jgi:ABC-type transport system involved in multi-copper enzyme maturation permease subunit
MNALGTALVVFRFELRRAVALPRLVIMAVLVAFPPVLSAVVRQGGPPWRHDEVFEQMRWATMMFILVPEVVCLLGLLLWATPVIHAEVDGKTWPYLAVRPCGKVPILLGKYLTAVLWTAVGAWLGLGLAVLVDHPAHGAARGALTLAVLVGLSSMAYGALFVLLGVLFLRRGIIVAVGYTFIFEFLVSWIPAMVKQFTVQYHLRNLLAKWMLMEGAPYEFRQIVSEAPSWQHVLILVAMTVVFLTAASLVLRWRQLITAPEV